MNVFFFYEKHHLMYESDKLSYLKLRTVLILLIISHVAWSQWSVLRPDHPPSVSIHCCVSCWNCDKNGLFISFIHTQTPEKKRGWSKSFFWPWSLCHFARPVSNGLEASNRDIQPCGSCSETRGPGILTFSCAVRVQCTVIYHATTVPDTLNFQEGDAQSQRRNY